MLISNEGGEKKERLVPEFCFSLLQRCTIQFDKIVMVIVSPENTKAMCIAD